jgi:pyruvate dehydrogenase E2 component (dihydrolipoamide acetyltransferase)
VAASPAARARAAALGVDVTRLAGSGPAGALTVADVERAAAAAGTAGAAPVPAPAPPTAAPGSRHALAALMERSNREIPHYYLTTRVDLSRALAWLAAANASRPPSERLLPAVLLLKAVALAARRVPEVNGFWRDDRFQPGPGIHLGVAISRKTAEVVVATLHDADRLPLAALMGALRDLVARARAGTLRSSELADSTLTVTNVGELGVDQVLGVIFSPQVALVGFGRVGEQPWAEGGTVSARPVVEATLAADHRASDGYRGGRFLAAVAELLQKPEEL